MKKTKAISLSISLIILIVGVILAFQLYPYLELKNCQISTNISNKTISITNKGTHIAEFPEIQAQIYRDSIFVGNLNISDFKIQPGEKVNKKIDMNFNLSLNKTIKLLNTSRTSINGNVYLPIFNIKAKIPFKIDKYDNGTTIIFFMGRKIVR